MIADRPVGSVATLAVKRGERELEFEVTTVELEGELAEDEQDFADWGLTARSVTAVYAAREQLPDCRGVLVTGVKSASPAQRAGLRIGDIIRTVDRGEISDFEAFRKAYRAVSKAGNRKILLEVLRGATYQIIVLKPWNGKP
jgi:C-terminal processing protease CtpA/Prc